MTRWRRALVVYLELVIGFLALAADTYHPAGAWLRLPHFGTRTTPPVAPAIDGCARAR
jgi:hypothetical protein